MPDLDIAALRKLEQEATAAREAGSERYSSALLAYEAELKVCAPHSYAFEHALFEAAPALLDRLAAAEAKVARMKENLAFYADRRFWHTMSRSPSSAPDTDDTEELPLKETDEWGRPLLDSYLCPGGRRARAALAESTEGGRADG